MRYTKVLILCENSPYSVNGGGVLLNNLFQEFPTSNLFFFHRNFHRQSTSVDYKEHRLLWTWLRVDLIAFVSNIFNWIWFAIRHFKGVKISDIPTIFLHSCRFHFPATVDSEVRNFKPEIIYAWTASLIWANTLRTVAKRYNLPYVIHFMDNHVEVHPFTPLDMVLQSQLRKSLLYLINNAAAILSISPAMANAYKKKWGIESEVYHGSIDTSQWSFPESREPNKVFTLLYNGSVDRGQLLGLLDVAEAVKLLSDKGLQIKLTVLVSANYRQVVVDALSSFRCVEIQIQPDFSELRKCLTNADLLVIAYGFDNKTISYFKYSFATKVVPYMLSGQCVLAYGPPQIEPIDYVRRGEWGVTVTERNIELLSTVIKNLYHNPQKRMNLAKLAWAVAANEHDTRANSIRFARHLTSVIKKNNKII